MSETKWTPGPWRPVKSFRESWPGYVETTEKIIAAISPEPFRGHAIHQEESTANAYLIAAAPDMYKALVELVDWVTISCQSAHLAQAHVALAKARGEQVQKAVHVPK